MEIRVKKLSTLATIPTKANKSDAGWDLYASEDAIIDPSKTELISTDISFAIPDGYVGLIWDRSGMAAKRGLHRFAGVIDSGYRGELIGAFRNLSGEPYIVEKHTRLLQVCAPDLRPIVVKLVDESFFHETSRQAGGFGSTGV